MRGEAQCHMPKSRRKISQSGYMKKHRRCICFFVNYLVNTYVLSKLDGFDGPRAGLV